MRTSAAGGYELAEFLSNETTPPRCQDAAGFLFESGNEAPELSETRRPPGAQRQALSREADTRRAA